MSDAVLASHKSFSKLKDQLAFRKFLFTIAVRIHKRKVWRHKIFASESEAGDASIEDSSESPHDLDLLMGALSTLPEAQRESLLLFEFSGLSIEEIRDVQGGSLSGVKSRLKRGRASLAKKLCEPEMRVINRMSDAPVATVKWKIQKLA